VLVDVLGLAWVVLDPVELDPVELVADGEAVGSAAATRLGIRNDAPAAPRTRAPAATEAAIRWFICLLLCSDGLESDPHRTVYASCSGLSFDQMTEAPAYQRTLKRAPPRGDRLTAQRPRVALTTASAMASPSPEAIGLGMTSQRVRDRLIDRHRASEWGGGGRPCRGHRDRNARALGDVLQRDREDHEKA